MVQVVSKNFFDEVAKRISKEFDLQICLLKQNIRIWLANKFIK